MTCEVAVLGAGNMGTALAQAVATNGHHVRLWSIESDVLEEVRDKHLNTKYLDGIRLHRRIDAVWDLEKAVAGAGVIIVSVPSQVVRGVARDLRPHIKPGQVVLNVAKGLESGSHRRMSEVVCEELDEACSQFVGSMGGPAIAIELARGEPMATIIAVRDADGCAACQAVLQNHHLKVAKTHDVTGLELCATLKNVYAIALGMCDGIGHGTNTKAFVLTLALAEMREIVCALGGDPATVYGLAGVGDLLTTGFSPHSRNRTLGEKLGALTDWEYFLRTNTVEGVAACRAVKPLIADRGLTTPLLDIVHDVLDAGRPAPEALRAFFTAFSYS